jgi:hypothetical protein
MNGALSNFPFPQKVTVLCQDRRAFCSAGNLWLRFGKINRNEPIFKIIFWDATA